MVHKSVFSRLKGNLILSTGNINNVRFGEKLRPNLLIESLVCGKPVVDFVVLEDSIVVLCKSTEDARSCDRLKERQEGVVASKERRLSESVLRREIRDIQHSGQPQHRDAGTCLSNARQHPLPLS